MTGHHQAYTVTRPDAEIDIMVDYTMSPIIPARTYGPAEHCYPAEGGEVEIHAVTQSETNRPLVLTDAEEAELTQWLADHPPDGAPDFGLNSAYAREMLAHCGNVPELNMQDAGAPFTMTDDDAAMRRVLMPMRV